MMYLLTSTVRESRLKRRVSRICGSVEDGVLNKIQGRTKF